MQRLHKNRSMVVEVRHAYVQSAVHNVGWRTQIPGGYGETVVSIPVAEALAGEDVRVPSVYLPELKSACGRKNLTFCFPIPRKVHLPSLFPCEMEKSKRPLGVVGSSASLPDKLATRSCNSWYSVMSTQLPGRLTSGGLSFSSRTEILKGESQMDSLWTEIYLQNLLEGIATLASQEAKLVVVPGLYDEVVGVLRFPVKTIGHSQDPGVRIYRELSLGTDPIH